MNRILRTATRPGRLAVALALVVILAAPVVRASSTPGFDEPQVDITWGQIASRVSCLLSSFLDMGLLGFHLGYGACTLYIRLDPGNG